jgi:outer membrane protein assembly factor BamB
VSGRAAAAALLGLSALLTACGTSELSWSARAGAAAGASLAPAATTARSAAPASAMPDGDWTTFDFNAQRTGVGPAATGITAANVRTLTVRTVNLPGTVDSSAIQLHGARVRGRVRDVAVLTTTYGRTLAVDPATGTILWKFTPAGTAALQGSGQITTATPVADPSRRYVYAASPDGRIHKLVLGNGHEVRSGGWPVSVTRDPTREKLASALNVSGRSLLVATGGYIGDAPPYQGHVLTIDLTTGRITHVFNTLCSNRRGLIEPASCPASDSAIWGRPGTVVLPGSHDVLVATGNAPFDGRTDWGDSVLELSPALRLQHNWTPSDQGELNGADRDLGSTTPAPLPRLGRFHLALQGGKSGEMALLNLDRLDGAAGPASPRIGGQLSYTPSPGGEVLAQPAVWQHARRILIFIAGDAGTGAYQLVDPAHPRLRLVWERSFGGTSPVVAGGLLYVYDPAGVLRVLDPRDGATLASWNVPTGHWNSPIVVGGRVILPTGNANSHSTHGTVLILHLPRR